MDPGLSLTASRTSRLSSLVGDLHACRLPDEEPRELAPIHTEVVECDSYISLRLVRYLSDELKVNGTSQGICRLKFCRLRYVIMLSLYSVQQSTAYDDDDHDDDNDNILFNCNSPTVRA